MTNLTMNVFVLLKALMVADYTCMTFIMQKWSKTEQLTLFISPKGNVSTAAFSKNGMVLIKILRCVSRSVDMLKLSFVKLTEEDKDSFETLVI